MMLVNVTRFKEILQDPEIGMVGPSRSKTQALIQTFNEVYFVKGASINTQRAAQVKCADLSERGE
jgi:hypothetical protein